MAEFERKIIRAQAPVRFDFGGGPTDVDPFKTREGGFVLSAGIKQLAKVQITERSDNKIIIRSDDYGTVEKASSVENLDLEGPLRLIKAAVKHIQPTHGLEINTKVDVPPGSGLGASASIAIALVGALRSQRGEEKIQPITLINDALYLENEMLKNINGGQDQYAAALGGFHAFEFKGPDVSVKTLNVKEETIRELESRSLLCFSGESHLSGAGGGGCAYFFCEEGKKDQVKEAFKRNKIPLIPMEFANEGIAIWYT